MKRIAIYPGTFNPFHEGHVDIVKKAEKIFDVVEIIQMINPQKKHTQIQYKCKSDYYLIEHWDGLLIDYVKKRKPNAIIRGLRNGNDLQYETNLQYWNEDLGLKIPIVYFICDRKYSHISSSAIRELEKFKK